MTIKLLKKENSLSWIPASQIERDFVRFKNSEDSPGLYQIIPPKVLKKILISVIIPTKDADRNGCFERLIKQLSDQTEKRFEIITVKGDSRQGRSINIGASLAKGKYLLTLDDDTSLPDKYSFEKLVRVMDEHEEIGIAGGSAIIPEDANNFVKKAMKEIPRRAWDPVERITDSDLVQHPCLIMRVEEFKIIGGENEFIPRGLDPYLREEIRKLNKRVVLVPDVNYYHLLPTTLKSLISQFYRNGRQAAYVNIFYPQWVIETPARHGEFKNRVPLALRIIRFPIRMIKAVFSGKTILLLCQFSYAIGFMIVWLLKREK
ncbi:MAG: glycosyltransferase [Chitinispirillia bacterium]|jgi:GT2 family glycosyltransferase